MLLGHSRNLLLILPRQIRDIAHSHREERPSSHSTECKRRSSAEENAPIPRNNRPSHSSDNNINTTGEEFLAGISRRRKRSYGVGEGVLDVQGAGKKAVEAGLGCEGLRVQEETGLSDLSSQDVCWSG